MKTVIQLYNNIKDKVCYLYEKLQLDKREKTKGRKLALSLQESIALSIFWKKNNIATKKALYDIFEPDCTYKTLVVNLNRVAKLAGIMLAFFLRLNRKTSHPIKHTDSTDVPVSLNKNARYHKTMSGFANWGKTGKGWFYGLKLHITTDLKKKLLSLRFTSGNTHDKTIFMKLNNGLYGIFIADAAYLSEALQREFFVEHKRILFTAVRKNMKKLETWWQDLLYKTRMTIEINFRNLKMFYGLITSLPRSPNGYFANYIHSLLAYVIA